MLSPLSWGDLNLVWTPVPNSVFGTTTQSLWEELRVGLWGGRMLSTEGVLRVDDVDKKKDSGKGRFSILPVGCLDAARNVSLESKRRNDDVLGPEQSQTRRRGWVVGYDCC
jgi:hypothetical protein